MDSCITALPVEKKSIHKLLKCKATVINAEIFKTRNLPFSVLINFTQSQNPTAVKSADMSIYKMCVRSNNILYIIRMRACVVKRNEMIFFIMSRFFLTNFQE